MTLCRGSTSCGRGKPGLVRQTLPCTGSHERGRLNRRRSQGKRLRISLSGRPEKRNQEQKNSSLSKGGRNWRVLARWPGQKGKSCWSPKENRKPSKIRAKQPDGWKNERTKNDICHVGDVQAGFVRRDDLHEKRSRERGGKLAGTCQCPGQKRVRQLHGK